MAKNKTSRQWVHDHINDPYVKQAQAQGYRSRAAFKLTQIDDKDRLLGPGKVVVDLGSTPGGWSQVASKKVGPSGKVVAIDLLPMEPVHGVRFILGDFREDGPLAELVESLEGRRVDLVLSDMAPNLSGIAVTDQGVFGAPARAGARVRARTPQEWRRHARKSIPRLRFRWPAS